MDVDSIVLLVLFHNYVIEILLKMRTSRLGRFCYKIMSQKISLAGFKLANSLFYVYQSNKLNSRILLKKPRPLFKKVHFPNWSYPGIQPETTSTNAHIAYHWATERVKICHMAIMMGKLEKQMWRRTFEKHFVGLRKYCHAK